jgi:hypothetical protein
MAIAQTLKDVRFVVGANGKPTAALIDIAAWQHIIALLEEAEDQGLLRSYLLRRKQTEDPSVVGLIPWEEAEAILDARMESPDASVD